jgi:proteic killer suppression protein
MCYTSNVIGSFLHKGLRELLETNKTALIAPALQTKCKRRLDALHDATALAQLNLAGFNLHQLRGKPLRYSIHVNGPWTITFEWGAPYAYRVDLEQYH